jgi:hypothetical protein
MIYPSRRLNANTMPVNACSKRAQIEYYGNDCMYFAYQIRAKFVLGCPRRGRRTGWWGAVAPSLLPPGAAGHHRSSHLAPWLFRSADQGVSKRCRLSLLTNSALVHESQCMRGVWGGGGVAGSQPMSTAVHIT